MRVRGRPAVVVEAHPEAFEALLDLRVVAVHDVLRIDTLFAGAEHDRDAVLVGAADVDEVAAAEPLVAAIEVGREVGPGEVAEMERSVGVREGGSDEDAISHGGGMR